MRPQTVQDVDPSTVIWREELRRRIFNRFVLLVLVVGLLYAGLDELYFDDDAFGTWKDYVAALTWGVGALFTLDAVSSALDKLRARASS